MVILTDATRNAYERFRKDGLSASHALSAARSSVPTLELDWNDQGNRAELVRDGFDIRLVSDTDDIPRDDFRYTDDASTLDIETLYRNPRAWNDGERIDHGTYLYCVPEFTSYTEMRKDLRARGFSRSNADIAARRHVRELVEFYCSEDYSACWVSVTASRHGVELGTDSLGGIEMDGREPWYVLQDQLTQMIDEHQMIDNAIVEARATLARLCECED